MCLYLSVLVFIPDRFVGELVIHKIVIIVVVIVLGLVTHQRVNQQFCSDDTFMVLHSGSIYCVFFITVFSYQLFEHYFLSVDNKDTISGMLHFSALQIIHLVVILLLCLNTFDTVGRAFTEH